MFNIKSKGITKRALLDRDILDVLYPVGAIYITTKNSNPSTYLGGSWVEFSSGRTLIGAGQGNDGSIKKSFSNNEQGGKYTQDLGALIGAYDSDINKIGYRASNKIGGYDYSYGFNPGLSSANIAHTRINHSTMILQLNGTKPTTIQPYQVVYIWRRIA